MRPRTVLALASAFLATGCLVAPHDSFATPHDTVRTFQSAFARDDDFKEYDCFARSVKDEQGLTQQAWSTARTQVFAPLGWIGRFVLRRDSLADEIAGGKIDWSGAKLVYELFGNRLQFEFEAEAVLVLPNPIDRREDAWSLTEENSKRTAINLAVVGPLGLFIAEVTVPRAIAERFETEGVPWAEIRHHWKIRAVTVADEERVPAPPQQLEPPRVLTIECAPDSLRPMRRGELLGAVKLEFQFPFVDADPNLRDLGLEPISRRYIYRWEAVPAQEWAPGLAR